MSLEHIAHNEWWSPPAQKHTLIVYLAKSCHTVYARVEWMTERVSESLCKWFVSLQMERNTFTLDICQVTLTLSSLSPVRLLWGQVDWKLNKVRIWMKELSVSLSRLYCVALTSNATLIALSMLLRRVKLNLEQTSHRVHQSTICQGVCVLSLLKCQSRSAEASAQSALSLVLMLLLRVRNLQSEKHYSNRKSLWERWIHQTRP